MGGVLSSVKYTPDGIPYYNLKAFKDLTELDRGGNSNVCKGYGITARGVTSKNQWVAVKLFNVTDIYSEREIQILKELTHDNVIKLFGVIWDGHVINKIPRYTGYVMEYLELGSIHKVIYDTADEYGKELIRTWIRQIGTGIQYLHEHGIMHRDIKPQNILLAARNHSKLADFGLARNIAGKVTSVQLGTEIYRAPEVGVSSDYGPLADVYSFGITIWEIIHRKCPGKHINIANGLVELPVDLDKINYSCVNFLKRCFAATVRERPSVQEIIEFWENYYWTIMVVLKDDAHPLHKILILDRTVPGYQWKSARRMDFTVNEDAIGWLDGFVSCNDGFYMIGGGKSRKNLFKASLPIAGQTKLTCQLLAEMNHGREHIPRNCVYLNGFIWVLGGYKDRCFLTSVERYDLRKDTWSIATDMKYARANAAAAICNGKIIICGGQGERGLLLNSVECFDPESGVWTELTPMPDAVHLHTLLNYKNMLVRLGGFTGYTEQSITSTVLALHPTENHGEWIQLEPMISVFDGYTAKVLDQEIFVFGHILGQPQVRIYNGNNWRYGPSPLKGERCVINLTMVISQDYADSLLNADQETEHDLSS